MLKTFFLSAFILIAFVNCKSIKTSKEIVFVCTHGAARSPIAAAYFNKLAEEKDINYHGVFRATEPDDVLTKETISGLKKDGFNTGDWKPERVTALDLETAYKIVTFDCNLPLNDYTDITIEWNGTPSISKDYVAARNAIKEHVEKLVDKLIDNNN